MSRRSREFIYGLNPCFEVLRAGRRRIMDAFLSLSSRRNPRLCKLAALLEARDVPVQWVDKGRVLDLAGSRENQGAVLRSEPYPYAEGADVLTAARVLLLDNVEDPHNVGAILRSAEIFGFEEVLMPVRGTPEIYPSVVKVSAGATEYLRIARDRSASAWLHAALERGYRVLALDGNGPIGLAEAAAPAPDRLLLVVGGENRAVGHYILREAHAVVRIPQQGRVSSLNAAVAAGIAMHALRIKNQ